MQKVFCVPRLSESKQNNEKSTEPNLGGIIPTPESAENIYNLAGRISSADINTAERRARLLGIKFFKKIIS